MANGIASPLSPPKKPSVLGQIRQRLLRRWKAIRAGSRDEEVGLAIEPLGFWPHGASAILPDHGSEPAPYDGYAFHTQYVPSTGGSISFRISLPGLTGTRGQLLVNLNILDQYGDLLPPRVETFAIEELLENGGEIQVGTTALFEFSYAVMGTLVDSDASADAIAITVTGGDSDDAHIARVEAAQRGFLADPGQDELEDLIVSRKASLVEPISQMCTASQMREKMYWKLCRRLGEEPKLHRKQWEFIYIIRSLWYHGALRPGARGLGFGVGVEPLPSMFASDGCEIVATDLHEQDNRARAWSKTQQLGASLEQIFHARLCDEETFRKNVSFRPVDMNAIPEDLTGFDFTWSSCAYEHLGSIEAGLAFFENSLKCLAPGGLAVHTTELNLTSNDGTLDRGNTVIFRRRDFEELARRLIAQGHEVFPITFDSGTEELDRVIDLPPYASDPHLKLALMRWVSTSFGMTVRKSRLVLLV